MLRQRLEEQIGIAPVFLLHLGIFQHVHHAARSRRHNHDALAQIHRFLNGMRHEHLRIALFTPASLQHIPAFLQAQKRIEVQKGLVHEQQIGIARKGARHGQR